MYSRFGLRWPDFCPYLIGLGQPGLRTTIHNFVYRDFPYGLPVDVRQSSDTLLPGVQDRYNSYLTSVL